MTTVRQVMTKKPKFITPETTLKSAASTMLRTHVGFIPIGNKKTDKLVGILTDRDITTRAVAKGWNPSKTPVKKAMTKKTFYCYETDNITKAIKSMCKQGVHRLLVVNKNKRLTGVISISDLAKKSKQFTLCGKALKDISKNLH